MPTLGGSGPICLPTNSHSGKMGGKSKVLPMQEDHSGVAKYALVLGPGSHVKPGPYVPPQPAQSADSGIQSDSLQEYVKPKYLCLAPRESAIKKQGFSEEVAAQIEVPQRGSTRSVYEAKWVMFTKQCHSIKVDLLDQ